MEQISYTRYPDRYLTQEEWMREFKVGIMAPKPDNGRAEHMMGMWIPLEKSFFEKVLEFVPFLSIFRS